MPVNVENAVVWSEIPVTYLVHASAVYAQVLDSEMRADHTGTMVDIIAGAVAGHWCLCL